MLLAFRSTLHSLALLCHTVGSGCSEFIQSVICHILSEV